MLIKAKNNNCSDHNHLCEKLQSLFLTSEKFGGSEFEHHRQFCTAATVGLRPSLASGTDVFGSGGAGHHVAQQEGHLGASHQQQRQP